MKSVTLLLVLFGYLNCAAQQPSHFMVGKNEFANIHVYSLVETANKELYAATNHGLFNYKNGSFKAIKSSDEQHGSALFSLSENGIGEVYCSNLAGQIFKLDQNELVLVTQVPKEYLSADFDFTFDNKNQIIVRSQTFLRYDENGWEDIYCPADGTPYFMNSFDPLQILFPPVFEKEVLSLSDGALVPIPNSGKFTSYSYQDIGKQFPAYLNQSLISISTFGKFSNYETKTKSEHEVNTRIFVQLGENEIWSLSKANGVRIMQVIADSLVVGPLIFQDQFISCITKSRNGTIYMGTFGSGVIVIPNSASAIHSYQENYFTELSVGPKGIMALNRKGSIYDVSAGNIALYKPLCAIERTQLNYVEGVDFKVDSNSRSILYTPSGNGRFSALFGMIKGVTKAGDNSALIASSLGVFRVGLGVDHLDWELMDQSKEWYRLFKHTFRCKNIAYDLLMDDLYYETEEGLFYITKEGKEKAVLMKGKSINCNHLMFSDGAVWCATQSFGVLEIKGGEVVRQIEKKDGLSNNYVHKTELHDGKLYISHKNGFQIVELLSMEWRSIGTAEGISNGSMSDFTVYENKLWFISHDQILSLPINQAEKNPDFILKVPSVKLGGSILDENLTTKYAYNENHLMVNIDFRGIEFEADAIVQLRLVGSGSEWKNLNATTKEIEFNALAPAEYQLELRVSYRNFISEPIVFPFVIEAPFWQTWWFYVIITLTLVIIAFVLFRIRLKKAAIEAERQLSEQKLNADKLDSELKALRSQMNPHFIFNSLNSIQDLILREETETSYDYIALFAKLVRNTLSHSNTEYILIEKELEFLDVYLSLEKLRFGDNFEFTISYKGDEEIEVPSLLIQPFVENALVHGLIHKKGLKKLAVEFTLTDKLACVILDNGVGRKRAAEIQKRQLANHDSFALSAIQKRLEILNQQLGEEVGKYAIQDLYDGETPVGTKVEIIIPHRSLF
jgi:hypothetical protein